VAEIGSNFCERYENKGALVETWMGEREIRGGEDEVTKEEQIEVERARTHELFLRAVAAKVAFNVEQLMEQDVRRDLRRNFELDYSIEECGLVFKADGCSAIER
jgi:hypothetical protein